jgi:hypothetical protein
MVILIIEDWGRCGGNGVCEGEKLTGQACVGVDRLCDYGSGSDKRGPSFRVQAFN